MDPNKDNSKGSDPIIPSQNDTRSLLKPTDTAEILSPLSNELKQLLPSTSNLTESVIDLFSRAEVIFQQPWALSTMVLRVTADIVVKLSLGADDTDEYSALEYLQQHLPGFPFPKPHGLIKLSHYYLMFMTYIPGSDLEKAWPQLDVVQKSSISSQLNTLFLELRSLPHPENKQLGGLQGQGCKDGRRGVRVSSKPIMNVNDFEDFVLRSGFPNTTQLYRSFLQGVCPPMPYKPVFTHGDVRPANIMVDKAESGEWKVVGIVDWERAGFYPEYWESVEMTNNLTHSERWDWYAHFPDCLHPKNYPARWFLDRVWDPLVEFCSSV